MSSRPGIPRHATLRGSSVWVPARALLRILHRLPHHRTSTSAIRHRDQNVAVFHISRCVKLAWLNLRRTGGTFALRFLVESPSCSAPARAAYRVASPHQNRSLSQPDRQCGPIAGSSQLHDGHQAMESELASSTAGRSSPGSAQLMVRCTFLLLASPSLLLSSFPLEPRAITANTGAGKKPHPPCSQADCAVVQSTPAPRTPTRGRAVVSRPSAGRWCRCLGADEPVFSHGALFRFSLSPDCAGLDR